MTATRQATRSRWESTEGLPEPLGSWNSLGLASGSRSSSTQHQASPCCRFPKLPDFGTAPLSPPPTQLPEAKARMPLAPLQMLARVPGSLSEPHIVFEMYPCGRRALAIRAITAFWPR